MRGTPVMPPGTIVVSDGLCGIDSVPSAIGFGSVNVCPSHFPISPLHSSVQVTQVIDASFVATIASAAAAQVEERVSKTCHLFADRRNRYGPRGVGSAFPL